MSIFIRLLQIAALYLFYLLGSWLQEFLHLPLSGSIVGLLLVLLGLSTGILKLRWIESGAHTLLSVLPIFFIPATIAVMNYGHFFSGRGSLLIPVTILSTVCTMAAASFASIAASRRKGESECS
ncbi:MULTISPECIES: CidA/LrgA family holin-like protein [Sporosarcina]|uniref:CidA/LrgA family holin-like protein n=1 Tax=Sporosarcina TaxID=1569 RepID=UPI0006948CC9|nr:MULTISPECIES: CidA/LrgA family holin-like protein [Sporosarcina]WJY28110.1 CidA/LrgA family holin-like protein [Sporosarcina sp. 0.2-SM1T-5]